MTTLQLAAEHAFNALSVIALDRRIRRHLEDYDPQALKQVEAALSNVALALDLERGTDFTDRNEQAHKLIGA